MKDMAQLQLMVDTNNLLLSLMLDSLVHLGQNTERVLKLVEETTVDTERPKKEPLQEDVRFRIEKVIFNILTLIASNDEDGMKAGDNYTVTLRDVLKNYEPIEKSPMPEGIKKYYTKIWDNFPFSQSDAKVNVDFTNVIHMLYY